MMVCFDTSVLVAATLRDHPRHHRAMPWIEAAHTSTIRGAVTRHGLLELYAVLTRLPRSAALDPAQALRVVKRLTNVLKPLPMVDSAYAAALEICANRGGSSGAVFDALHLATAGAAGADAVLTFNTRDFTRLAGPTDPSILLPPDPPRVDLLPHE